MYKAVHHNSFYVTILNSNNKIIRTCGEWYLQKSIWHFQLRLEKLERSLQSSSVIGFSSPQLTLSLIRQCFERWFRLAAVICYILQWWLIGCCLSYFNESDLELAANNLGHLNEEGWLVGVVFDDVVVHVDVNPEEKTNKNKRLP